MIDEHIAPSHGKGLLAGRLEKAIRLPDARRAGWLEAVRETTDHDPARANIVSYLGVGADLIRKRIVRRGVFAGWPGRVVVLSAENDPTQGKGNRARFTALFGRPAQMLSLGALGHTAAIVDPDRYVELLGQALA